MINNHFISIKLFYNNVKLICLNEIKRGPILLFLIFNLRLFTTFQDFFSFLKFVQFVYKTEQDFRTWLSVNSLAFRDKFW